MLSRRLFLIGTFGILLTPLDALARKVKVVIPLSGPRSLARQEWPPAIAPDFAGLAEKGYVVLADQAGRLAVVDLRREDGPHVLSELSAIGKRVVDMTVQPRRAFALVAQDVGTDSTYALASISFFPPTDATITGQMPLTHFAEPTSITSWQDLVCVAGTGSAGDNIVVVYSVSGKGKAQPELSPLATIGFQHPIAKMDLSERKLAVLESGHNSQLSIMDLINARSPARAGTLKLDGQFTHMARMRDSILIAGQGADHRLQVRLIDIKGAPQAVARQELPMTEVLDVAAQKGQYLVLGNEQHRLAVMPYVPERGSLSAGNPLLLPSGTRGGAAKARLVASLGTAYVTSDWGGVQVLNIKKSGWQYLYSHTIPRLPASAIVVVGNKALLAGTDLKLYDIQDPSRPVLLSTTELASSVRSLAPYSDRILLLTRDSLSLRMLDKPGMVLEAMKLSAASMAVDLLEGKAYLFTPGDKETSVTPVEISDKLRAGTAFKLPIVVRRGCAFSNKLLLSSLNDLKLVKMGEGQEVLGERNFPELAIRDMHLGEQFAVISAVDHSSKGYLVLIDTSKADLPTLGSIDLPQDGTALAVVDYKVVVVGRSPGGKDLASIIDISNPVMPKVLASLPVVEAASSVSISDRIAIVGGRGLEVLSLG